MSIADSAQIRPPSPPASNSGELLQDGFHHILMHNANTPMPRSQQHPQQQYNNYADGSHLLSASQSSYGSPTPGYDDGYYDQQADIGYPQQQAELGMHYGGYGPRYEQNSRYGPLPDEQLFGSHYGTPVGSPHSTPSTSTPGGDFRQTRNSGAVNRPLQALKPMPKPSYRPSRSPRIKKNKKDKAKPEHRVARLDQPLSVLTAGWTHVPVVDIEAYVNRPAEQRRAEVEEGKNPGKVKRPMNSFMLYRKAYQNRTKNWCLQNNHQVVSQVCGDSWPLEPESVREQFNEWARIERLNHQNAHPGYKFSPSKAGAIKAAKRKEMDDYEAEESDLEDYDWGGPRRPAKVPRLTPRPMSRQHTPSPLSYSRESSFEPSMNPYNLSAYHTSNPGRPPPMPYNQSELHNGQYYQQSVQRNERFPMFEDVMIRKTAPPGMHYMQMPIGFGMGQQYQSESESEVKIDPILMAPAPASFNDFGDDGNMFLQQGSADVNNLSWQQPVEDTDRALPEEYPEYSGQQQGIENLHILEQQLHVLKDNQDSWHVETLDAGCKEFDKWMDEAAEGN